MATNKKTIIGSFLISILIGGIVAAITPTYDLNGDGRSADAVDVNMMMQAWVGDIPRDERFDLNGNGRPADFCDVGMMVYASVGDMGD